MPEDINKKVNLIMFQMRKQKKWTRGQVAKKLKTTPTIIYNLETGRSRIKLSSFLRLLELMGYEPGKILAKYLSSIHEIPVRRCEEIVKHFRNRLKLSQRDLSRKLGYKSAAMVHHFEKGIREPSFEDFLKLMELAGDNIQGMVKELTDSEEFAKNFPAGLSVTEESWVDYWSAYYVAAIHHLMRTTTYRRLKTLRLGYFAKALGITYEEERHALAILSKINLIKWCGGKPVIDPSVKVVVPKDIPREVSDNIKSSWLDFNKKRYLKGGGADDLLSIDIIPINVKIFKEIIKKIRYLQDDIHSTELTDTDGFACLGWSACYVKVL